MICSGVYASSRLPQLRYTSTSEDASELGRRGHSSIPSSTTLIAVTPSSIRRA